MTKFVERRKARELRRQGLSYGQILEVMHVSKSSLSLWLKDVPLSKEQILGIKDIHKRAVEKYRETMKVKHDRRLRDYYNRQKKSLLPISKKELFLAGLFLYWGEGSKSTRHIISVNNTDPSVVKFALYWMVVALSIPKEKIRVQVHLYNDMDIEKEIQFWSNELGLNKSQFAKPYVKNSTRLHIDQKGFGHGTCGIYVCNTVLKENILMAIKSLSDDFSQQIRSLI